MFSQNIMSLLTDLTVLFPAFLLVFTFRGFAKALVARLMGDDTAQKNGFLTLNPLVHVDLLGLVIVLFVLFFLGGLFGETLPRAFLFILLILIGARWTIPVPINENNFKKQGLGVALTSIAGALGNFFLALLFFYFVTYFPFKFFPKYVFVSLIEICSSIIEMSIFFGVLDLIPLPPFDGGRLLQFILPSNIITWLENYSMYVLLALFFLPGLSHLFFGFIYMLTIFIKQGLLYLVF